MNFYKVLIFLTLQFFLTQSIIAQNTPTVDQQTIIEIQKDTIRKALPSDTIKKVVKKVYSKLFLDSLKKIKQQKRVIDSLQQVRILWTADSLSWAFISAKRDRKNNPWLDSLMNHSIQIMDGKTLHLSPQDTQKYSTGQQRKYADQWLFVAFQFFIALFALFYWFFRNLLSATINMFFSIQITNHSNSQENTFFRSGIFILLCIKAFLIMGFTIYYMKGMYDHNTSYSILVFLEFFAILSIFFILKVIILRLLAFIFKINEYISKYIYVLSLFLIVTSWILLFFLMLFLMLPQNSFNALSIILYICLGLLLCYKILFMGVDIFKQISFGQFSIFYIILYLCTLEISPILFLIKFFSDF